MKRPVAILAVAVLCMVALPAPAKAQSGPALVVDGGGRGMQEFDAPLDAYDFDGDGDLEIVGHNQDRRVFVVDGQNGAILHELTTRYPAGWGARSINPPEVATLEAEGAPHIVVANSAAVITLFRYDGEAAGFSKVWDRRMTECHGGASMDAQPVLHDLDGDGGLEILVQTEEVGVYALHLDGSTMWKQCIGGGNGEPAVADMDFDGTPDVVFASDGGVVTRINGRTGGTIWSVYFGGPEYGLGVASMPVGPTIGQINGVGALDVAVGARDTSDHKDPHANTAALIAIGGGAGNTLWVRQHPDGAPLTYTHPIIHDVDGDGEADVLWADWNTVGHKPPFCDPRTDAYCDSTAHPWEVSGTPAVYRYDSTGDLRFRQPIGSYWHNNDLALADIDGDGVQEILVDDGAKGMAYMDSRNGQIERHVSTQDWLPSRGPTVYDLYGRGTMQWILPVHRGSTGGIMVFDTGRPYDAAWPHVPDHDASGDGTGSSGGSSGDFTVSFDVPDTTNNWWVETYVEANGPVAKVTATAGGTTRRLDATDWGSHAKSFYVADGTTVTFTATSSSGATATSQDHTWGDAAAGSGGSDEPFSVDFTVPDNVNEWWIEVDTDENHALQGVTVSIDGGGEKALGRTDWGTWAKSIHAPSGSQVRFTATDVHGHTATSPTYSWLDDGGPFTASFRPGDTSNNWWVEVTVDANRPPDEVLASVDGGSWRQLDRTDWGTWAKSFFVPDGAEVRFQARHDGERVTSQSVTWV